MGFSRTTVAYGLTVRSASLVVASDAWTRLAAPFTFLDLVALRRRSGTLRGSDSSSHSAITGVPVEVWEEVRSWLVQEELAISEDDILRYVFRDHLRCSPPVPHSQKRWSWSILDEIRRWSCRAEVYSRWARKTIGSWQARDLRKVETLLSNFGLALAYHEPIPVEVDGQKPSSSLAFVAAPSRPIGANSKGPLVSADNMGVSYSNKHTIVDLSFNLPRDIDQRFTRLVRLFNLCVVESSVNMLSSGCVQKKSGETDKEDKEKVGASKFKGVKNSVTNEIRPRWIIWGRYEST